MKTRTSLVSNSSSTSFVIRGIKVSKEEIKKILDITLDGHDDASSIENVLGEQFNMDSLHVSPNRNYFNYNDPVDSFIIGENYVRLEDGEVIDIAPPEGLDEKLRKIFDKLGLARSITTFVQYVSNDNC